MRIWHGISVAAMAAALAGCGSEGARAIAAHTIEMDGTRPGYTNMAVTFSGKIEPTMIGDVGTLAKTVAAGRMLPGTKGLQVMVYGKGEDGGDRAWFAFTYDDAARIKLAADGDQVIAGADEVFPKSDPEGERLAYDYCKTLPRSTAWCDEVRRNIDGPLY